MAAVREVATAGIGQWRPFDGTTPIDVAQMKPIFESASMKGIVYTHHHVWRGRALKRI